MSVSKYTLFIGLAALVGNGRGSGQEPQTTSTPATTDSSQQSEYSGPSILSRGAGSIFRAPTQPIKFQPFLSVGVSYDAGLTAVTVLPDGTVPSRNSVGAYASFGVTGYQKWRRASLSSAYSASYSHYNSQSYFNSGQQNLAFVYSRQLSRHSTFSFRESAGLFSRGFYNYGYDGSGSLDPNFANTPRTDIFDGQTYFLSTAGDLTIQKSSRLSFNTGVQNSVVRRRSSALFGATIIGARGDVAYRLTRNTTTGFQYNYSRFFFTKAFGGTDVHSVGLVHSMRLGRRWEISGNFGVSFVETQGLRRVNIDPVIAALLGQSYGIEAIYRRNLTPAIGARLSRGFRHAHLDFDYHDGVSSGNGVYLTSRFQSAGVNYSYSGFGKWTISSHGHYNSYSSLAQTIGKFNSFTGGISTGRQLVRHVSWNVGADAHRFDVGNSQFGRTYWRINSGLSFSPSEIPLAIW
ncbi:MAG: hypothetical protein HYR60_05205 [Acidobacteria bacterium]|nr:hypothetical protein [Acidobacteriota bacterium]